MSGVYTETSKEAGKGRATGLKITWPMLECAPRNNPLDDDESKQRCADNRGKDAPVGGEGEKEGKKGPDGDAGQRRQRTALARSEQEVYS